MDPEENKSPEVKAVIGFATKSAMAGATPKAAVLMYRSVMVISLVWSLFIQPVFTNIPMGYANHIDKALLALNGTLYAIGNMFGWVIPKDASKQTTEV